MSQFDDELRSAARRLASESLPPDILDEALDDQPHRPRWILMGAVMVMATALVLVAGIGIGGLLPTPSSSPSGSPSPPTAPTDAAVGECESVAAPSGGEGVVLVFFPCGAHQDPALASGTRSVSEDLPIGDRLRTALRAALDGPTELERAAGMAALVPAGSAALLASVDLASDGLAIVDFDGAIREVNNLSTSAASGVILEALSATSLQFDEVTAVEFRLGGSCDAFFELVQSACQHFAEPVIELSDCPIIPPTELPSGAHVGQPRPYPGQPMVSWGSGDDTVTELPGHRDGGPSVEGGTEVSVRGFQGWVQPTGDLPLPPPIQIGWVEEGCPYTVFLRLPGGEDAAVEYAGRFGPILAQPSAPPAEPLTASVEEEGIRFTVTLDRDRTVFRQPVLATATIENIGGDSVFWGHSGTCVFPASITIRPDDPVGMRYGRSDWPGDGGVLKTATVGERLVDVDPAYRFIAAEWLDYEGNFGCTGDLVVSELLPGDSLVQRVGWDTLASYEMPPPPGRYSVDAVFAFMSRGAPPEGQEAVDELSVAVSLPMVVEGPEIDYVSPGEAVDALLSDEAFQAFLADAPRGLWVQSVLTFIDGRWELVLYLSASDREVEPVEALVGTVDARSGIVLEVMREPRTRPPGG